MAYTHNEVIEQNRQIADTLFSKEASSFTSTFFQDYTRNDGVARCVIPQETVTADEFVHTDAGRDPYIIRTMTPKSHGSIETTWDSGTVASYLNTAKFRIYLNRTQTPKYTIDKIHLTAYRGPIMDVIKDLTVMDLLRAEDEKFLNLCDTLVGTVNTVNADDPDAGGVCRYIELGEDVTTKALAKALSGMSLVPDAGFSVAKCVIHKSLWFRIIMSSTAHDQGDRFMEDILAGNTAKYESNLYGVHWISSNDVTMVKPVDLYMFGPTDNVGNFISYEEPQMISKVENNWELTFGAAETTGMMLPTTKTVFKASFTGADTHEWTA